MRKFPRSDMVDMLDGDEKYKIIYDNIVDNSRWSIHHEVVFEFENKFYKTSYRIGATENQDERPWEYDDTVDCQEVKPVEKTVIVYEKV
jgi:hypothetical protein